MFDMSFYDPTYVRTRVYILRHDNASKRDQTRLYGLYSFGRLNKFSGLVESIGYIY